MAPLESKTAPPNTTMRNFFLRNCKPAKKTHCRRGTNEQEWASGWARRAHTCTSTSNTRHTRTHTSTQIQPTAHTRASFQNTYRGRNGARRAGEQPGRAESVVRREGHATQREGARERAEARSKETGETQEGSERGVPLAYQRAQGARRPPPHPAPCAAA